MVLLCSVAFFASGFAALVYQVIWQRMLVIFSGADLYSVTIIVAAFMGGLGLGNLAGGHVADRTSARNSLLLFAGAELAIALFGAFSVAIYYGFLYVGLGDQPIPAPVMAGILFASLLWPTFFMGASLPMLARALSARIDHAASIVGVLYGMNTLGAATGAFLATWVLIPAFGLEGTLRIAVSLNITCAVLLLPAAFAARRANVQSGVPGGPQRGDLRSDVPPLTAAGALSADRDAGASADGTFGLGMWALAFGLSGLLALSLEIVWFRVLAVMMKSTAFTFGTLLSLYLTGVGAGSLAGSALAPRLRHPARGFFLLQTAVAASAVLLLVVFVRRVDDTPLWTYLGSYEPLSVRAGVAALRALTGGGATPAGMAGGVPWNFLIFYFGVPALLVLPPTILMGCSFPVLQRAVLTTTATIGRRVGLLLLANVLGSMLGTVVTGWLLLDWLGTAATIKLLALLGGLFALAAVLAFPGVGAAPAGMRRRGPAALGVMALLVGLLAVMPGEGLLWAHLHGANPEDVVIGEDGSGLSVIKAGTQQAVVFVNGIGQSRMPYGDVHTALGALPAFLHPSPRTAAVIGLGSGDTVHAVAGRRELDDIASVEIIRGQVRTLEAVRARFAYPGLVALLSDRRVHQVFADGRIYLRRGGRRYDIIEADALRPSSAYSGTLYSDAYFALVRDRLAPHGLAATWAPTQRVYNTFIRTFPHVVSASGILVGSLEPIDLDRQRILARLDDPFAVHHFANAGIDIRALFEQLLAAPAVYGPDFPRDTLTDINTDLFPKDEFDLSPPPR